MLILIDNYDSFTYNLVQYFGDLKTDIQVVRNDVCSADDILSQNPSGIVISPGPSNPDSAGVSLEIVSHAEQHDIPLLGVCLGHQSIAQCFGANIVRAPEPMHGKVSMIHHTGHTLFRDIPSDFEVVRYHSLVAQDIPDCLEITAQTHDGIIMGLSHKTKPIHGVQFHPESIATDHGHMLLNNFLEMI